MSTADLPELLPCPFCGEHFVEEAESAVPTIHGGNKRAVYCNGCFAEGPTADTPAEAIAAWNERAGDKRAREAVEARGQTGYIAPKDRYVAPVLFNPYTGEPRDVRDIRSDPQGALIVPPGASLAASPSPDMLEKR